MQAYRQSAIRAGLFGFVLGFLALLPEAPWLRVILLLTAFAWFVVGIRRFALYRKSVGRAPLSTGATLDRIARPRTQVDRKPEGADLQSKKSDRD